MRRSVWATLLAMLLSLLLTQVARAAAVTQTWSVGNEPFGVTVDPRDGKVYVAQTNASSTGTSSLDLRSVEAEIGDVITVEVVVSDRRATATASATAIVAPAGR